MTLTPLLNAEPVIQLHAVCAGIAVVVVIMIFALPRGSRAHRVLGWIWVVAMALVALSSFGIHRFSLIGPFSPIHLLSAFTLAMLVVNVRAARMGRIGMHRRGMRGLVFGALILAGAFTFLPGRIMFQVVSRG